MARISGIDLKKNKRIDIALTGIYGIGRMLSAKILADANVDPSIRTSDLTEGQVNDIRKVVDGDYTVEGDLRKDIAMNIKRLQDLVTLRGMRHRKGLPVRGQRTSTNARTRKGPKRGAVASGRK